ncbi:alpha/beta fold hydrolase [Nonomuraea sp. NPDC052634]|uniref:alpha/beta fold hydrolase n=1 Tax=Nonomuraea sp. NPDC052634 TaxID=3155813 RepID=UPI0034396446
MAESRTAILDGLRMHYLIEGDGPLLVLLHGWPQTSHCWHRIMPELAKRFTVVAPDLRGYGLTDKPTSGYDKRTMAADVRALVRSLGHTRVTLVGHDRGARVAHRYALDHPDEVERLVVMDIVPTREMWARFDMKTGVARGTWHWTFHLQPDLPERLAGHDVRGYLDYFFDKWTVHRAGLDVEEYVRAFERPGALRAGFDDYRASFPDDAEHDEADWRAGRRLEMPVLALWGSAGLLSTLPVLDIWRKYARDVRGTVIPECGHFLAEERPDVVLAHLRDFFDGAAEPPRPEERPVRADVTLGEIQIRDPFLLSVGSTYWLYGSTDPDIWSGPGVGFDTYRSEDLRTWEGPFPAFRPPAKFWSKGQFWAPEVHPYSGRYYMFATFTAPDGYRGTQVLVADTPEGPFQPWSDGAVTPRKWQCLDGTLFVDEAGDPWIVYCQEWQQVHDGAMWAQRLSADLRETAGTPVFLFNASDAPWVRPLDRPSTRDAKLPSYVTDGPFLFRLSSGHLLMLWSSYGDKGYAMGIAHSESGLVTGPWTQEERPLWAEDGGHGMIVRLRDGSLALTLHQPNDSPNERAVIRPLVEHESTVTLAEPSGA